MCKRLFVNAATVHNVHKAQTNINPGRLIRLRLTTTANFMEKVGQEHIHLEFPAKPHLYMM